MTAKIIDGKAYAAKLRASLTTKVTTLKRDHNLIPGLAVIIVGEDPASAVYVRNKNKQTLEIGMQSFKHELPAATSQSDLLALVAQLNANPNCHGILVQLPLPPQIDPQAILNAIDPAKDVDGFHVINAGKLATGGGALIPCTPLGCLLLLRHHLGNLSGKQALVVGRSNIVGKPMAALLLGENCTVTLAHSHTADLAAECGRAEILIAAVGRPKMIQGDWIAPGATVIDVGINRIEPGADGKKLVGDVDYETAVQYAGAITPVPGGVGPMTIACLLRNTVTAFCRQNALPESDA